MGGDGIFIENKYFSCLLKCEHVSIPKPENRTPERIYSLSFIQYVVTSADLIFYFYFFLPESC